MMKEKKKNEIVEYYNVDFISILTIVRDRIHLGHKLLTHPLSSSIKPNVSPYKTIHISYVKGDLDVDSLSLIEESIATYQKLSKGYTKKKWSDEVLLDFQLIDYSINS